MSSYLERMNLALPALLKAQRRETAFSTTQLAGDASSRQYHRAQQGSATYMVMVLPEGGVSSLAEEVTKTTQPITELPFVDVQRYLMKRGVRVPKLLGYDIALGVLLLEDLGDALLLNEVGAASADRIKLLYERALDELEKLAVIPNKSNKDSIAFNRTFDRDLYNWEFHHFVEYGLDHRLKSPPKGKERETLVGELEKVTDEYLKWEKVFCHRDYHGRNLLVLDQDQIAVIDFQDALLGPLFYDLASLLRDSYFVLDPKLQDDLVETYRQQMKKYRLTFSDSRENFRRAFDLMGMHRNLKAAGRFCYFDKVKGNPRYLADVPRTLKYVEETLDRYPDLKTLKQLMGPYLPEVSAACSA